MMVILHLHNIQSLADFDVFLSKILAMIGRHTEDKLYIKTLAYRSFISINIS